MTSRVSRRAALREGAALALAAAGAAPAACVPLQDAGTPAQPAGPASIAVWFNPWTPAIPAWEQTVREFEARQPRIKVSIEHLAGGTTEQEEKILAAAAAGTPPDVSYVHPIFTATFAVKGIIVPLDPFLTRSKGAFDLKEFYPGAIDYFRWDGKLWALPNYSGPNVFYYNKSLLQQVGLADPWELYQKGEWTIARFDDYVLRLTKGQGDSKTFGTREVSRSVRVQSPWIQGFGGEVWNAKVTETLLHQDGAVRAWEYLAGQVIKGQAPRPEELRGVSGGVQGLFTAGRVAFYDGIRSEVPAFKDVAFGVVPKHKMADGKEYNRDGPNGLSLTQGSRQHEAGWQFMMFELTRGVELKMGTGFTAPTTRSHAKSPLWLNLLIGGENARVYEAAANQVKAIPHPPRMTDIDRLIQAAYGKVVNGEAAARAAMVEIKPQVDAILAERGK
jgi:multiple sugar transport system substrate-binding protein